MTPEALTVSSLADESLLANASPRPWYFDGRDILTASQGENGHRLVVPLPNTIHPSARVSDFDAELIVRAVNAYEEGLASL
jgi:hypothetical protein